MTGGDLDPRTDAAAAAIARDLGTPWPTATTGERTHARIIAAHALTAADTTEDQ